MRILSFWIETFEINPDDISETQVLKTVFSGKEVYSVE